jgi:hypothetical protein
VQHRQTEKKRINKSESKADRKAKPHSDKRAMSNTTTVVVCMVVPLLLSGFANFYAHKWWILYLPLAGALLLAGYLGHLAIISASETKAGDTTTPQPPSSITPKPPSVTPTASPSTPTMVTPAPTLEATPTPSPVVTVPTPESTLATPAERSASQIMDRIKSASVWNRDEVAAGFIDHSFNETLFFTSASRIGTNKETMFAIFRIDGDQNFLTDNRDNSSI